MTGINDDDPFSGEGGAGDPDRVPGSILIALATILAAMTGSTIPAGTLTIPAAASQSVRVWATVKAETWSRSGFHFRVRRKTPSTKRM